MLSKLNENLFKRWSRYLEILDHLFGILHVMHCRKQLRKTSYWIKINIIRNLICQLLDLVTIDYLFSNSVILKGQELNVLRDVLLDDFFSFDVSQSDCVTFSVIIFQMSWTSIYNKSSINHDCNVVTQWFCFIHAMCCQNQRALIKIFKHFEQTSPWNWIDTCCWLIEEFTFWWCK